MFWVHKKGRGDGENELRDNGNFQSPLRKNLSYIQTWFFYLNRDMLLCVCWRFLGLFLSSFYCALAPICWLDTVIGSLFRGIYVKTIGTPDADGAKGSAVKVVPSLSVLPMSCSWTILRSVSLRYSPDIHLVAFTFPGLWAPVNKNWIVLVILGFCSFQWWLNMDEYWIYLHCSLPLVIFPPGRLLLSSYM